MNFRRYSENLVKRVKQNVDVHIQYRNRKQVEKLSNRITILNTAIDTDNIGDEIIMYHVKKQISSYFNGFEIKEIATHTYPTDNEIEYMRTSRYVFVCGTNILSPRMELYSGWRFDNRMIALDNVVLVGVGWWGYQNISAYTKFVYSHILANNVLQSVRDSQAEKNLRGIGVNNVINTNCLTTWGLDKKSTSIPTKKSDSVILTLTGVYKQKEYDKYIIKSACKNYKRVLFFPQGLTDLEYFNKIVGKYKENIEVIDGTLAAYDKVLEDQDIDYIGSRLHGGIHALQKGRRSIIVVVDNRAREMGKDLNLPIIEISDVIDNLDTMINSEWETVIRNNNENIAKWRNSIENALKR